MPVPELLKQAGVRVFNDMSVRQASQMMRVSRAVTLIKLKNPPSAYADEWVLFLAIGYASLSKGF